LEGLLEVVGLELMAKGIIAGTHSKSWREKVQSVAQATSDAWDVTGTHSANESDAPTV